MTGRVDPMHAIWHPFSMHHALWMIRCVRVEILAGTLFALARALSTLLGPSVGFWVVGVVFMALFVLLAIAYTDSLWKQRDRGISSEAAFVVTLSPC